MSPIARKRANSRRQHKDVSASTPGNVSGQLQRPMVNIPRSATNNDVNNDVREEKASHAAIERMKSPLSSGYASLSRSFSRLMQGGGGSPSARANLQKMFDDPGGSPSSGKQSKTPAGDAGSPASARRSKTPARDSATRMQIDDKGKAVAQKEVVRTRINPTCFDELPSEIKKQLYSEGLSEEEGNANWQILKSVLQFRLRKKYIWRDKEKAEHEEKEEGGSEKVPGTKTSAEAGKADAKPHGDDREEHSTSEYSASGDAAGEDAPPKKSLWYLSSRFMDTHDLFTPGNPRKTYKSMHTSGQGAFGRVFSALEQKKSVAIKTMPHSTEREIKSNTHEISILRFCQHQNIVAFYRAHLVENAVWVVMEFLQGGTLTDAVEAHPFKEREIAYVAREMLQGIAYLHSHQLAHRDLKSSNVMMTVEGDIKLIDFGLCCDLSVMPTRKEMVGSPLWVPPEMIRKEEHNEKVDIWSFGICLLELANGRPPFYKYSFKSMFLVGTEGVKEPLRKPELWSDLLKDFLVHTLEFDQHTRHSAEQLLAHAFLHTNIMPRSGMKTILSAAFLQQTMAMFNF